MTGKLKENLIAFGVAVLLTGGVILAINSSSNLATDVLGVKKNNTVVSDVKLDYNSGSLFVVSNKNIDNVLSLSLELLFNKEKVSINRDNLDASYSLSATEKEGGNGYTIIIQNIGKINKGEKLLTINNITKEQYDNINIGHIQLISNNGVVLNLTVSK